MGVLCYPAWDVRKEFCMVRSGERMHGLYDFRYVFTIFVVCLGRPRGEVALYVP